MSHKNNGWTPDQIEDLSGKTFLITGANAGAGFEASRILLSKGAAVVMLNRSTERSVSAINSLKNEFGGDASVSFIKMDLANLSSVRTAAKNIQEQVKKIDTLICNAAIAQIAVRELTEDGHESQLGTNHYGHFLLSGLLFEQIEASKGRIVVVASEGHKMGLRTIKFDDINWDRDYTANDAYSQSKLAQMMFAYELQNRIKVATKSTSVYVCHPGSSNTSLIDEKAGLLTRTIWSLMTYTPLVQSAERGAYPEVMCATESNLIQRAYYGPTGFMNFGGPVGECNLDAFTYDPATIERLWQVSEEATSFKWAI